MLVGRHHREDMRLREKKLVIRKASRMGHRKPPVVSKLICVPGLLNEIGKIRLLGN